MPQPVAQDRELYSVLLPVLFENELHLINVSSHSTISCYLYASAAKSFVSSLIQERNSGSAAAEKMNKVFSTNYDKRINKNTIFKDAQDEEDYVKRLKKHFSAQFDEIIIFLRNHPNFIKTIKLHSVSDINLGKPNQPHFSEEIFEPITLLMQQLRLHPIQAELLALAHETIKNKLNQQDENSLTEDQLLQLLQPDLTEKAFTELKKISNMLVNQDMIKLSESLPQLLVKDLTELKEGLLEELIERFRLQQLHEDLLLLEKNPLDCTVNFYGFSAIKIDPDAVHPFNEPCNMFKEKHKIVEETRFLGNNKSKEFVDILRAEFAKIPGQVVVPIELKDYPFNTLKDKAYYNPIKVEVKTGDKGSLEKLTTPMGSIILDDVTTKKEADNNQAINLTITPLQLKKYATLGDEKHSPVRIFNTPSHGHIFFTKINPNKKEENNKDEKNDQILYTK